MNKLAIIDRLGDPRYYLPLAEALGGDRAVFHYSEESLNPEILRKIKQFGLEAQADDSRYSAARRHQYFLADSCAREGDLAQSLEAEGKRFICYLHSLDGAESGARLQGGDFLICPHDFSLFASIGPGRFLCSAEGEVELGRAPGGYEAVTVGPFHISEADLQDQKSDRASLKERLAQKIDLDPARPLVCYFVTEGNESASADKGLQRLAEKAEVIIKTLGEGSYHGFSGFTRAEGPNIHLTDDSSLNWLMRIAADAVLVDPHGGGFITAVMTGLRHIPVHTTLFRAISPPQPVNFTHFYHNLHTLNTRLAHCVAPIHIEATEMILERIADSRYWERFEAEIAAVGHQVLGRYWLGREALGRARIFIIRALERGTFSPSRSELGASKIIEGPLNRNLPFDVTL